MRFGPAGGPCRECPRRAERGPGDTRAAPRLRRRPTWSRTGCIRRCSTSRRVAGSSCSETRPASGSGAIVGAALFKTVRVHAPLTSRLKSWVKSHPANRNDGEVLLFDVVVLDADGRVCIEIEESAMRNATARLRGRSGARTRQPAWPIWPIWPIWSGERDDPWRDARATKAFSPGRSALQRNFEHGIQPAEGMEALTRIPAAPGLAQVVATLDRSRRVCSDRPPALGARCRLRGRRRHGPRAGVTSSPSPPTGSSARWPSSRKELLGVRRVGLRESFFDLGGHSLIAVRLFARIKKAYEVEFPISLLFEAPTIERCAEAIRARDEVGTRGHDVPPTREPTPHAPRPDASGSGGDKTPVLPRGGHVRQRAQPEAPRAPARQRAALYGLQALGLYGTHRPHESFEEMARDYLVELRRAQPRARTSSAGSRAAGSRPSRWRTQLLAAGEEVALLAMPRHGAAMPAGPQRERARSHPLATVRRHGPSAVADWMARQDALGVRALPEAQARGIGSILSPRTSVPRRSARPFRTRSERYTLRPLPWSRDALPPQARGGTHVLERGA